MRINEILPSSRSDSGSSPEWPTKPADASHMLTISFIYNCQMEVLRGKKKEKVDYVQDYTFVGYLKK